MKTRAQLHSSFDPHSPMLHRRPSEFFYPRRRSLPSHGPSKRALRLVLCVAVAVARRPPAPPGAISGDELSELQSAVGPPKFEIVLRALSAKLASRYQHRVRWDIRSYGSPARVPRGFYTARGDLTKD